MELRSFSAWPPFAPPVWVCAILGAPLAAFAHGEDGGHAHGWPSQQLILANLLAISLLYGSGYARRRKVPGAAPVAGWRAACFAASIAVLLAALVSPIDAYSGKLGWVHMIQHMLLMMVAAPLFILGAPARTISWALPGSWKRSYRLAMRRLLRWRLPRYSLSQPILIWLLFAATLWIWHLPVLYEGALRSRPVHDLQHITFFAAAGLFWQALLHPLTRRRLNQGLGVFYLFLASIHSTALGALMAISPVVWYPYYAATTPALGYSPLQDQQLAGYIMWMPACMIYLAIAVALAASWLMRMREPGPARMNGNAQGA